MALDWLSFVAGRLVGNRPAAVASSGSAAATIGLQKDFTRNPVVLNPQPVEPQNDTIRSATYPLAYSQPHDVDNYGQETDTMREAYRRYFRVEPAAKAAIEGLVAKVAVLDVSVLPDDEDNDDDKRAAEFVQWTVDRSEHGWDGLVQRILTPAMIDGYSVTEKVFRGTDHGRKWGGLWGLDHCRNKDTAHLRLRLDVHWNILGVVNTVRGLATYSPEKIILFTHADLFSNPFGSSELRSAYRACQLIDNAYKLWHFALAAYGGPFLKAMVKDKERRPAMMAALEKARAGGYIVYAEGDAVDIVNMASATSFDAFKEKIDKLREEVFLSVRGGYLPFMQGSGNGGETRGSADTSKSAGTDPKERLLSKAIGRCLTRQLAADLVLPNFGPRVGIPRVTFGGTDWGETKAQLDVADQVNQKVAISKSWYHQVSQVPPPTSDEDAMPPSGAAGSQGAPSPVGAGGLGGAGLAPATFLGK